VHDWESELEEIGYPFDFVHESKKSEKQEGAE